MTVTANERRVEPPKLTKEKLLGKPARWRRFGEYKATGGPTPSGKPDYGILGGPGSISWEVMLHPTTIVFLNAAQGLIQANSYNPIVAGLRDHDGISRKAVAGTLNVFDVYERAARSPGMHAAMWVGDTETAKKMAAHLFKIHTRVAGDVIDTGRPELGGYNAAGPRESMWAGLTELHPMLWAYEAFAFRGGWFPRRLKPAQRDAFIAENAAYLRLNGADEAEIPHSMADVKKLYAKYDHLFEPSDTIAIMPGTGVNYEHLVEEMIKKNFHPSYIKALIPVMIQFVFFKPAVFGAVSKKARWSMGVKPHQHFGYKLAAKLFVPIAMLLQTPLLEGYFLRRNWGPDATHIIKTARKLHKQALKGRKLPGA